MAAASGRPDAVENEATSASEPAGPRGLLLFLACALLGGALDLGTKWLAFQRIAPAEVIPVVPGLINLTISRNPGAAFGILDGAFGFFVAISVAALALLGYFAWTAGRGGIAYGVTLGLVGAGVIGNLYDRLRFRHVRDFIDVYAGFEPAAQKLREWFGTNHWPTFNLADAFICVGAALLLVRFWREERVRKSRPKAALERGAAGGARG